MTVHRYAENTSVPIERSRAEIESLLKKHGASAFFSAFDDKTGSSMIGFRLAERMFRIEVKTPTVDEMAKPEPPEPPKLYTRYVRGVSPDTLNARVMNDHKATVARHEREHAARAEKWIESEGRRRWRAQLLLIKAKLEMIAMGASSVEREFLADMLMANNKTVGQQAIPALAKSYAKGGMPSMALLLGENAGE